jgi:predicted metal-binding membrane protein
VGGVATPRTPRSTWRLTPQAAVLLIVAAIAWVAIIAWSSGMAMSGTMGLTLPAFLVAWTVMMAAMMLPSVAPVASLYARSIASRRGVRLTLFTSGYLLVWAASGVIAFSIGSLISGLAGGDARIAIAAGVVAYLAAGLYQLSPLKYRCLSHCRSPLSLFFHYSSYQGPLRDLRVGAHHGAYCLGCCWALMLVLLALGAMSLVPMLILAVVVLTEKLWSRGEAFAHVVGVACLVLAVATIGFPGLAPGFAPPAMAGMNAMPSMPSESAMPMESSRPMDSAMPDDSSMPVDSQMPVDSPMPSV